MLNSQVFIVMVGWLHEYLYKLQHNILEDEWGIPSNPSHNLPKYIDID